MQIAGIAEVLALAVSIIFIVWLFFKYDRMRGRAREAEIRNQEYENRIGALDEAIAAHKEYATKCGIDYKIVLKNFEEEHKLVEELQGKYATLMNQKKSSEVRLGQIGEHIAPFLHDWPWESKDFRFLGNPVDGIQFNTDEIIFVEIKTGKSQLSKNQRIIRDLIKAGKVKWAIFRIGVDECSIKMEERE
jgi:predicted Holliday junction resolvase-like endonuclease